jgi:hypothetical protein
MASTRNRNTTGNYKLEQNINKGQAIYFTNTLYSVPVETCLPGDGLLTGRIGHNTLSYNGNDIESFLFGIGSTNLEEIKPDPIPQIKTLKSLNIINRSPVIIPEPLVIKTGQRYYN